MSDDERWNYRQEHMKIHGHYPIPSLDGRKYCIHPQHDAVERILDAPGVDIEIPFEFRSMFTEDDGWVQEAKGAYDKRVAQIREQIAEAEEEDAFEQRENKRRLF